MKRKEKTKCSVEMQEHIRQLGLPSVEAYKAWCRAHNFASGLHKNDRQLRKELVNAEALVAAEVMKQRKSSGKDRDIRRELQKSILSGLEIDIEGKDYDRLRDLMAYQGSRIRPLETWRPQGKTRNLNRLLYSLAHHLFVADKVKMPVFMRNALFGDEKHRLWFMHIGRGQNIRTAPDLPLPLTKKMAHHFLKAPGDYTVEEAFCYGQVLALGGNGRFVSTLRGTRLIRNFDDNDFRLSVLRFFIANPMLDLAHVHPIIDYIWAQKYGPRAPQPNFSMKGRDPVVLLRRVAEWHRELAKIGAGEELEWTHSVVDEFHFQEGSQQKGDLKSWSIRELISSAELVAEGRALSHCVSTYAVSCAKGETSIWSMAVENESRRKKLLTIEVSFRARRGKGRIVQIRGKGNRLPTRKEKNIIEKWAVQEELQIGNF